MAIMSILARALQVQQLTLQGPAHVVCHAVGHPSRFNSDIAVAGSNGEAALHGGHLLGQGVSDVLFVHIAVKVGVKCVNALHRCKVVQTSLWYLPGQSLAIGMPVSCAMRLATGALVPRP